MEQVVQVFGGPPSAEETAALVAVLVTASGGGPGPGGAPAPSRWRTRDEGALVRGRWKGGCSDDR
jgi:hypothetical protein